MNESLKLYIESQLANGVAMEKIRVDLESNNWPKEEIDKTFGMIEGLNHPKSKIVTDVKEDLPKWVKITFRIYGVFVILATVLAAFYLVSSFVTKADGIMSVFTETNSPYFGVIEISLIIFSCVIIALQILYGIGVYKFNRWVLPVALVFSVNSILFGIFNLLNPVSKNFGEYLLVYSMLVSMGLIGFLSIKYWKYFKGSSRKLKVQIPLILLLLPGLLLLVLTQIFTDDAQINDSDLILNNIEILNPVENAHYPLPIIDNLSTQEKQEFEGALALAKSLGDGIDTEEAKKYSANIKNLTDSFIEASKKSGYQCPTLVNNYSAEAKICSLNDVRDLALLTAMRAKIEAASGEDEQALKTSMSVVRMGSLMSNSEQPILIEYLVGIAVTNIGLDSLQNTLSQAVSTPDDILVKIRDELGSYLLESASLANSSRREYMLLRSNTNSLKELDSYFYRYNKSTNELAELFRKQIDVYVAGCGAEMESESEELRLFVEENARSLDFWLLISPNSIGKILNSVVFASLNSVAESRCESNELNQSRQAQISERVGISRDIKISEYLTD